jgi:catechol 2,3-dioxygenase-like lactoylglutathione lyase family enzyme
LPAIGLNHINITAPLDVLQTLRDFYCDVLGLTVGERPAFRAAGYWLYAGGQPIIHLFEGSGVVRQAANTSMIDHVAFTCTEFEAMRTKLDALQISYTLNEAPRRAIRQLFFHDPAGNGIELHFSGNA